MDFFGGNLAPIIIVVVLAAVGLFAWSIRKTLMLEDKSLERGIKMVPLLIHLPPATDDIGGNGKDPRAVAEETISMAEAMYGILSSIGSGAAKYRLYGQRHVSFEIVATTEGVKYYVFVPISLVEVVRQAVASSYPSARLEEVADPNIFNASTGRMGTVGGQMLLGKDYVYPIATYKDTQKDAALAIINAMSTVKADAGVAIQLLVRPVVDGSNLKRARTAVMRIKEGKNASGGMTTQQVGPGYGIQVLSALWTPPDVKTKETEMGREPLTNLQQSEIEAIENKTKYPNFEVLIRLVSSSSSRPRAETLLNNVIAVFAQFNSSQFNGFQYNMLRDVDALAFDYMLRRFPKNADSTVLNSVELATIFHLPSQSVIPTSKVQKQMFKQVDGPAVEVEEGVLLGVNEFRGERKEIRLGTTDRRRHLYMIGGTGVGKTGFLHNLAYQDMMDGRGFAFLDPHGDAVEELMSMVPQERMDDIIYFDPGDMNNPIGMNLFEFTDPDQKDFIVQEGINMLYSLYDPGHTGIFGPRGEQIFRNAALLLMSDPAGGTFIDVARVITDPDFRNHKLRYVTDRNVYDYWTKEWVASQKSSEAGEIISWMASKWGPFISNTMMRNIIGQVKSGFNIRDIMDNGKILLVNLSKGKMGELNSRLLGMIFVMKFQAAAMSRADTPEEQRRDFCLFVDEFQNFSTDSFESIMSEARKYRLSLVLANQFMTQLTDNIREAVIGNVGTKISGRIGITDAELFEKEFAPTFTAEDLHKLPNYQAIATVLINSVPSAPFSMTLLPPMGEGSAQLLESMKAYAATMYGRPRAEVDAEIDARITVGSPEKEEPKPEPAPTKPENTAVVKSTTPVTEAKVEEKEPEDEDFISAWISKKNELGGTVDKKTTTQSVKAVSAVENTVEKKVVAMPVTPDKAVVKSITDKVPGYHGVRDKDDSGETHIKLR